MSIYLVINISTFNSGNKGDAIRNSEGWLINIFGGPDMSVTGVYGANMAYNTYGGTYPSKYGNILLNPAFGVPTYYENTVRAISSRKWRRTV